MTALRDHLREQTAQAHQRLDDFVASMRPFEVDAGYRAYLTAMLGAHRHYGEVLDRASTWAHLPPTSHSLRSDLLADLGDGLSPPSKPLPFPKPGEGLEETWASAYVIEGSAVGARFIIKQVQKSNLSHGSTFLSHLAEDSFQRWPKFVEALNGSGCDVDKSVSVAKNVFGIVYDIFSAVAEDLDLPRSSK